MVCLAGATVRWTGERRSNTAEDYCYAKISSPTTGWVRLNKCGASSDATLSDKIPPGCPITKCTECTSKPPGGIRQFVKVPAYPDSLGEKLPHYNYACVDNSRIVGYISECDTFEFTGQKATSSCATGEDYCFAQIKVVMGGTTYTQWVPNYACDREKDKEPSPSFLTADIPNKYCPSQSPIEMFPESYRAGLKMIQSLFPSWTFERFDTGVDWNSFMIAQDVGCRSLTDNPAYWKEGSWNCGQPGWQPASPNAIKYYADPRNFLNEKDIFQFELLQYDTTQSDEGVKKIFEDFWMMELIPSFIDAANTAQTSLYYLTAKSKLEMGPLPSKLAEGNVKGYEGYFNFYNIGAYPDEGYPDKEGSKSALVNGAIYAKSKGWNSQEKAIIDGAAFCREQYIDIGQDTLYLHKWDLVSEDGLYKHQFMQNIRAAYLESRSFHSAYAADQKLHERKTFRIPVFMNMPPNDSPSNDPGCRIMVSPVPDPKLPQYIRGSECQILKEVGGNCGIGAASTALLLHKGQKMYFTGDTSKKCNIGGVSLEMAQILFGGTRRTQNPDYCTDNQGYIQGYAYVPLVSLGICPLANDIGDVLADQASYLIGWDYSWGGGWQSFTDGTKKTYPSCGTNAVGSECPQQRFDAKLKPYGKNGGQEFGTLYGVDCGGFVRWVAYNIMGASLPMGTNNQQNCALSDSECIQDYCPRVTGIKSLSDLKRGDVIYTDTHVWISDGQYADKHWAIDSLQTGTVTKSRDKPSLDGNSRVYRCLQDKLKSVIWRKNNGIYI